MLANAGSLEFPKHEKKGKFSGKSIFSMLLPKELDFEYKSGQPEDSDKEGRAHGGHGNREAGRERAARSY